MEDAFPMCLIGINIGKNYIFHKNLLEITPKKEKNKQVLVLEQYVSRWQNLFGLCLFLLQIAIF